MKLFTTRTRARYAETDTSGIVYYGSYLLYFEVGRIEMFRQLALPYDAALPIVETHCRYRAPAHFDELLEVQSFVRELRSKGFSIGCEVRRVEGDGALTLLAEGYTAMVTVDEQRRPVPLPARYRDALSAARDGEA